MACSLTGPILSKLTLLETRALHPAAVDSKASTFIGNGNGVGSSVKNTANLEDVETRVWKGTINAIDTTTNTMKVDNVAGFEGVKRAVDLDPGVSARVVPKADGTGYEIQSFGVAKPTTVFTVNVKADETGGYVATNGGPGDGLQTTTMTNDQYTALNIANPSGDFTVASIANVLGIDITAVTTTLVDISQVLTYVAPH